MIVGLKEEYTIKSNRESGYGRYDVMLIPKNKKERGIIFEFKKVDKFEKENVEKAIESAKKQIIEKNYESEMKELEIENIIKIAVVFEGKNIEMEIF
jgi:pyruvoyl-dependent arginine decarboxylase (PvlArgDC)